MIAGGALALLGRVQDILLGQSALGHGVLDRCVHLVGINRVHYADISDRILAQFAIGLLHCFLVAGLESQSESVDFNPVGIREVRRVWNLERKA